MTMKLERIAMKKIRTKIAGIRDYLTADSSAFKIIKIFFIPLIKQLGGDENIDLHSSLAYLMGEGVRTITQYNLLEDLKLTQCLYKERPLKFSYYKGKRIFNKDEGWKVIAIEDDAFPNVVELEVFKEFLDPNEKSYEFKLTKEQFARILAILIKE